MHAYLCIFSSRNSQLNFVADFRSSTMQQRNQGNINPDSLIQANTKSFILCSSCNCCECEWLIISTKPLVICSIQSSVLWWNVSISVGLNQFSELCLWTKFANKQYNVHMHCETGKKTINYMLIPPKNSSQESNMLYNINKETMHSIVSDSYEYYSWS